MTLIENYSNWEVNLKEITHKREGFNYKYKNDQESFELSNVKRKIYISNVIHSRYLIVGKITFTQTL